MAMGLIGALARRRVRVPQDNSVAGFDDIQFAACFVPAIATIRQPRRAMGLPAVALMHRPLRRDGADLTVPNQQILPHTLILLDSATPPATAQFQTFQRTLKLLRLVLHLAGNSPREWRHRGVRGV